MAKANKKEVKNIKVKIIYDNFINKYTKKKYPYNKIVEVTEKRLGEIIELEKTSGKKLIEIIEDTSNADDTNKDIVDNENGGEKEDNANNNDGDSIDENENGDNDNADNENGGEKEDNAE